MTMCLIFLAAGAFSGTISAAGGVESTVNLGLSLMPPSIAVMGLFVIGCFISVSMGTSVGTITAMAPIGVGIAQETGLGAPLCLGAVVCGAMFGDNLSMISDTTIAAVRTQGCEMKDKFKENFLIVLPAAIITAVIFFFVARAQSGNLVLDKAAYEYEIVKVIPYLGSAHRRADRSQRLYHPHCRNHSLRYRGSSHRGFCLWGAVPENGRRGYQYV